MADVEFKKSVYNCGSTGDIIIGDNNIVTKYSSDDFDFDELSELLETVSIESDIKQERKYATEAKKYSDKHDKTSLKQFISERESAFTSGTFATVAGGILLELIKKVLKF